MSKRDLFPKAFKDFGDTRRVKQIAPLRFHVISVEETEEWGDDAESQYGKYCVSLSEVNLNLFPWALACGVLNSCGWSFDTVDGVVAILCPYDGTYVAVGPEQVQACLVDCAVGHGARAPLFEDTGNNLRQLVREALRESRDMCADPEVSEDRLDRPVNAIYTSAQDYMLGRLFVSRDAERDALRDIYRTQYGWEKAERLLEGYREG